MLSIATLPLFVTLLMEASCILEQQASWNGDECSSSDSRTNEGRGTSSEQVLLQTTTVREPTGVKKPESKDKKLTAWTVPLSEDGYKEVARLQDNREMAAFITRVAEDLGYEIQETGDLMGVVPYYNGKKALQSLKALKKELKRVAKSKKGWLTESTEATGGTKNKKSREQKKDKGSLKDLEETLNNNDDDNNDDNDNNDEDDEADEADEDEDEANDEAMEMHHRPIRRSHDLKEDSSRRRHHYNLIKELRELKEDYSRRRHHYNFVGVDARLNATSA